MATLLLSCDEYIFKHNGQYYATDQARFDFFQRYLRVFDKLRLVVRCEEENLLNSKRVLLSSDPRIEFVPIPMFHGPKQYARKYFAVGQAMKGSVCGCDAAVLRLPSTVATRLSKELLKAKIPYATEIIYDASDGYHSESNLLHKLLWKRIDCRMRYLCVNADGVSCVTEHYLQKHYYSEKEGSIKGHYSTLALNKEFYTAPREYPDRTMTIAHVANGIDYNGRKGTNELINAISILKEKGIIVNVQFAGGTSDHPNAIKLLQLAKRLGVNQQIEFVGFLSRSELSKFLENADLFVMPTKAEGLPRVIIEAMAKALPCVSTSVSGNSELINSHFLVSYDDIVNLANRIEELISSPQIYESESKANYEKSLQYEATILEHRRDLFYSALKAKCR